MNRPQYKENLRIDTFDPLVYVENIYVHGSSGIFSVHLTILSIWKLEDPVNDCIFPTEDGWERWKSGRGGIIAITKRRKTR